MLEIVLRISEIEGLVRICGRMRGKSSEIVVKLDFLSRNPVIIMMGASVPRSPQFKNRSCGTAIALCIGNGAADDAADLRRLINIPAAYMTFTGPPSGGF